VTDRADDQPAALTELHAFRCDRELRVERLLRRFVADELAAAHEPDAARIADERVRAELREPRLKVRRNTTHMIVELALLVDLERPQRDRRGDRMPRIRVSVPEKPYLAARLD